MRPARPPAIGEDLRSDHLQQRGGRKGHNPWSAQYKFSHRFEAAKVMANKTGYA
jgi:hypothetical protein